jgi:hypothetical protein
MAIGSRLKCVEGASQEVRAYENGSEEVWETEVALYEKYYGKAAKQIIKDWFSQATFPRLATHPRFTSPDRRA